MWGFFNITFEVTRKKEADRKEKKKTNFLKNYILPQQNFGVGNIECGTVFHTILFFYIKVPSVRTFIFYFIEDE